MSTIAEALGGKSLNIAEAIKDFSPSGGSDSNEFVITVTQTGYNEFSMDKEFAEIDAAYQEHKDLIVKINAATARLYERSVSMGGTSYQFQPAVYFGMFGSSSTSININFTQITISSSQGIIGVGKNATLNFN